MLRRETSKGNVWLDVCIVVFLLSIIGSIVIPRFVSLRSDAHRANNEGTVAAMNAALKTIQRQYQPGQSAIMVTIRENVSNYYIVSDKGHPIGYGYQETEYNRFDDSSMGARACRDLFKALLNGQKISVVSDGEYEQGSRADYVATLWNRTDTTGCQYTYLRGQTPEGLLYRLYYDSDSGRATLKEEEASG